MSYAFIGIILVRIFILSKGENNIEFVKSQVSNSMLQQAQKFQSQKIQHSKTMQDISFRPKLQIK
uniref:Uncharacterized protein n=1 Tax=Arundo donax TaxID=35708 RepID=A0A0A9CTR1_ARUDO